ncbi:TRAP transporter small permease [Cytobacillus firmus]|uniref:TRAP transporter small permease n=1 Tax=Cytobacillus firmus TaxID=1399 RepID=UPI0018CDAFA1|nr:TRAP transporter small permease [Cytobacillus firmus]MBG9588286.1 C4-dicarboxylate ABC transporter permease [Cytobacillus firmus]
MVVKKIVDSLNAFIKWILILLFFIMVIVVFLQVLFRFVLDQPLAWTEELSRYLLVWITFLGAGFAVSVKAHPSIELLFEKANQAVRRVLLALSTVLVVFFFYQIIVNSFVFIERSMMQTSPALQLPMGMVYMVIPIASILFVINLLYITISEWRREASS